MAKRILIIGSGGREHAICWKIAQSRSVEKVFCAPGNAGIESVAECVPLAADDFGGLEKFVREKKIDLTVVGPETPLAAGIADYFVAKGLNVFGPGKAGARLESSKVFAKNFMATYLIPTASFHTFANFTEGLEFIGTWPSDKKLVVKADGLAAGKGVLICDGRASAEEALRKVMKEKIFGSAGNEVIIEEFLDGEEASLQIFLDGSSHRMMVSAQDHKRVFDYDQGPNTGGMGAYAPAPVIDSAALQKIERLIIEPLIKGLKKEGIRYKGVLYIGLMMVGRNPFVIEFNVRFGDPETQVVLPLLKSDLLDILESTVNGTLDKHKIEWYNKSAVCVILASGGYPGDYRKGLEIRGLDGIKKQKDTLVFHAGTASDHGKTVTSGGRVLGVTGLGDDISEAVRKAYESVKKIDFEGMHYRKDIAQRALSRT